MGNAKNEAYGKIDIISEPEVTVMKPGLTQGIDVSKYQPKMNWDAVVNNGFQAVVAKATDGQTGVDSMFKNHAASAKLRGLAFGAYCFNRFSADPLKQAEHFVKTAFKETHWLVADIEFDKSATTKAKYGDLYAERMDDRGADHSIKFLERITELTGVVPWIYLNAYHFVGFKNPERFLKYPCWVSNYIQKAKPVAELDLTKVHLPKPYTRAQVIGWQYTSTHPAAKSITGDGNLDGNLFYLDIESLRKMAAAK